MRLPRQPHTCRSGVRAADVAVRAYRLLLHAYPAAFRAAYGRDMEQLFRDLWADHRRARATARPSVGFWAAVVWDVTRSAPALRLEAARAWWRAGRRRAVPAGPLGTPPVQPQEGAMKAKGIVAVLAMLGGAFEIVNTWADVWAHGREPRGGGWMLAVALSALFGVLLTASGVALVRRGPGSARFARRAALASLVLVVGLQLGFPFMSLFSRLVGLALPIALLLVTRRPRDLNGGDPSLPAVA